MSSESGSAAATFCATLVDEWLRAGLTDAFVAPGSRSTPLALALTARSEMAVHLLHDERAASFAALGHGLATGRPAVVLCTSGTAAAHFHAAIIEADLSGVPMLVCTADRPPELWDVGAPQTVNQSSLYGRTVRFYAEPGVPTERMAGAWRSIGAQLANEALGSSGRPGPVHANLSFADPLTAEPDTLPPGRADGRPWSTNANRTSAVDPAVLDQVTAAVTGADGVVIAGRGTDDPEAVIELAHRLGWPLLADHRSGCRIPGGALRHGDALLRFDSLGGEPLGRWQPEVAIRFGEPLSSKALSQWLGRHRVPVIRAVEPGQRSDPERLAMLTAPVEGLASALVSRLGAGEAGPSGQVRSRGRRWADLDTTAAEVVAAVADQPITVGDVSSLSEPGLLRSVLASVPDGSIVVVSSSMPVRDLEWYGDNRAGVRVLANRGANGIDGVVATGIGAATSASPTTVVVGDVAFLHDSTSLIALTRRSIDLTIVVIDNDGGGIFSFLPQADLLDRDRYELLFGTPHGTDLVALCRAHGLDVEPWDSDGPVPASVTKPEGVNVVVARSDRPANRELHAEIGRRLLAAVEGTDRDPAP